MQTDNRGPSAGAAAGQGKSPPTICSRLQAAFQSRPAFRPLLRLTGRPQDGGAATSTGGAPTATHGGTPPPPVLLPAHAPAPPPPDKAPKATAPVTRPVVPVKPAAAKGGDKPAGTVSATAHKVGEKVAGWMPAPAKGGDRPSKAPASAPSTVSATANRVTEKVSGWMPVPAPPAAATTGKPSADAKAEDKAQQTKGRKTRVSSRVRKALDSSK